MNKLNARIKNLHETESFWNDIYYFVPEASEIIVYDPDDKHLEPRFKIGDGKRQLKDLPFFTSNALDNIDTIDGGEISSYTSSS